MLIEESNGGSSSTRFEWRHVMIEPPARAKGAQSPEAAIRRRLQYRDMRKPTPAVWSYRGGPEGWVQIDSRGTTWRFPGDAQLIDVLRIISKAIPLA